MSCALFTTRQLYAEEKELLLLLNADNALPVSVVLDSRVRVVMRELRGRSGPATETETDGGRGVGERKKNICESSQEAH